MASNMIKKGPLQSVTFFNVASLVKSQPFNETVNICHTPVVRKCGNESFGPDICSTHYETNCETRYKTYEVEQDEPVCRMEIMKKCEDVTSKFIL